MSQLLTIWRASLRSTANVIRFDSRARIGAICGLLIQLALGIWALSRLIPMVAQWKVTGDTFLSAHLWLTCLLAWPAIALFSVLSTLMPGLNGDEALLLATQPIEPATRLRALYCIVLWRGIGNWLLFEASLVGLALLLTLGWAALPWILLLVLGAAFVAWLCLVATLLIARYVIPYLARAILCAAALAGIAALLILLARTLHWATPGAWSDTIFTVILPIVNVATPFVCVAVAGCLLLAYFPLARRTGQLYLATLQQLASRDSSPRSFILPGMGILLAYLNRWRTPTGALLVKGLLQQSRHLFAWLRLLVLVVLLALFPLLRPQLLALHLNGMLQVALYAACVTFMALIEYAPYAIGSEGARLALYLVAPFDIATFLRARLCSFLLPALLIGWLSTILLGIETRLNVLSLFTGLTLLSLILTGYVALTVFGSALDADLAQVVEDNTQALILEEFPITPRRLQLLGLTLLLFGGMLTLCWKLPLPLAFVALAGLDTLLIVAGRRSGRMYLIRLGQ